jgi:hypothetical protein
METSVLRVPQLVTERHAARILAVSTAALRRWRRESRGPQFSRVEGCIRYDLRSISAWVAQNSSSSETADSPSTASVGGA